MNRIDDKVIVDRNERPEYKHRGHFAGWTEDGKPTIWMKGRTSYSTNHDGKRSESYIDARRDVWDNIEFME